MWLSSVVLSCGVVVLWILYVVFVMLLNVVLSIKSTQLQLDETSLTMVVKAKTEFLFVPPMKVVTDYPRLVI